jgi:hypothetical protein
MVRVSSRVPETPATLRADPDAISNPDFRHLKWIDSKGLMPDALESLGKVLLGWRDEYAAGEVLGRGLFGPEDGRGICVFGLPTQLVTAIARLPMSAHTEIATQWSARERDGGGLGPDAAAGYLSLLVPFAQQAVSSGRGVYMWMSP